MSMVTDAFSTFVLAKDIELIQNKRKYQISTNSVAHLYSIVPVILHSSKFSDEMLDIKITKVM